MPQTTQTKKDITRIDQAASVVSGVAIASGDTLVQADGSRDITEGLGLGSVNLAVYDIAQSFRGSIAPDSDLTITADLLRIRGSGRRFNFDGGAADTGSFDSVLVAPAANGIVRFKNALLPETVQMSGHVSVVDSTSVTNYYCLGGVSDFSYHSADVITILVVAGQQLDGVPARRAEARVFRDWAAITVGGHAKLLLDAYTSTGASVSGGTIQLDGGYIDWQRGIPGSGNSNFYGGVLDLRNLKETIAGASGSVGIFWPGCTIIQRPNGPTLTFETTTNKLGGAKIVYAE